MGYKRAGFSLIELSIVIVIISLIAAAIIGGQTLAKQARLRQVVTDFYNFETAFNTFRSTYNAIPGDIDNASSYWSTCGESDADACNGDGNGVLSISAEEDHVAWEHMTLAGLTSGNWGYNSEYELGTNIVPSPFKRGGYWLWEGFALENNSTAVVTLGSQRTDAGAYFNGDIISAPDAYILDVKIDDGSAGKGRFITLRDQQNFSSSICVDKAFDDANFSAALYILSDTSENCNIQWALSYR